MTTCAPLQRFVFVVALLSAGIFAAQALGKSAFAQPFGALASTQNTSKPNSPPPVLGRSILEFGGVGDGKTDNAAAFQNALMTLTRAGGGTLMIPQGVFVTSATLSFTSATPIAICGAGSKLSVIHYTGKSDGIFVSPQLLSVPQHLFVHLKLINLQLTGTQISRDGVHIVDASEFFFEDIIVSGFGRDGLRASAAQYGHIYDSTFAANGRHGLNFSIADLAEGRGVILNNTWELDNVYFMSNHGWGYRDQDGFNITCHNCTFQGNTAGGSLETGDTSDQIGEIPPVLANTGIEPMNNIYDNCHWEWNGNINQYIQYGQRIRTIDPLFASTDAINGDWVIGPRASIGMVLDQPSWLSVGPHIVINGGDYHRVDTGGVAVTVNNSIHSYIYFGNQLLSDLSSNKDVAFSTDSTHRITVAGGSVAIKSTNGNDGIMLFPKNSSKAYQVVGVPTAERQVSFPDADSTTIYFGTKPSSGSCNPPAIAYDTDYAYFCTTPNHWKRMALLAY